jgi:hypothetical protein
MFRCTIKGVERLLLIFAVNGSLFLASFQQSPEGRTSEDLSMHQVPYGHKVNFLLICFLVKAKALWGLGIRTGH